uniref:CHK domain-containing protein n=1 Tax=Glossina pallidipes TaxID=7398 RepID=A0A1A9ZVF6_GLOPL
MVKNSVWRPSNWVTHAYVEKILKESLKSPQIRLLQMDLKPATQNGENYASVMSRIYVKYVLSPDDKEPEERFLILKSSFENDHVVAEIFKAYKTCEIEMVMYERILPKLLSLLGTTKLYARTLKVDYDHSAIIFEDLSANGGYILADRLKGLDEKHIFMILKKLAKFHAAAAVLNKSTEGSLEKFNYGMFNKHTDKNAPLFEHMFEVCAKYSGSCPQLGKYYQEKLKKLIPYIVEKGRDAYESKPHHFSTLCHGDLWVNNMLFLYNGEDKSPEDFVFIDFQLCRWTSPAIDLHYFFNTSLEPKLHLDPNALDRYVQFYHSNLEEMLRSLNYSDHIPSLREFVLQLEETRFVAVTASLGVQPVVTTEPAEGANFRCFIDDTEKDRKFRQNLYRKKRLQNNAIKLLPYFDARGLLDVPC